jgi:hypothetical protein
MNTPQPMDAVGECSLYDGFIPIEIWPDPKYVDVWQQKG